MHQQGDLLPVNEEHERTRVSPGIRSTVKRLAVNNTSLSSDMARPASDGHFCLLLSRVAKSDRLLPHRGNAVHALHHQRSSPCVEVSRARQHYLHFSSSTSIISQYKTQYGENGTPAARMTGFSPFKCRLVLSTLFSPRSILTSRRAPRLGRLRTSKITEVHLHDALCCMG